MIKSANAVMLSERLARVEAPLWRQKRWLRNRGPSTWTEVLAQDDSSIEARVLPPGARDPDICMQCC